MKQSLMALARHLLPGKGGQFARAASQSAQFKLGEDKVAEQRWIFGRHPEGNGKRPPHRHGHKGSDLGSQFRQVHRLARLAPSPRLVLLPLLPTGGGRTEKGATCLARGFYFSSHNR